MQPDQGPYPPDPQAPPPAPPYKEDRPDCDDDDDKVKCNRDAILEQLKTEQQQNEAEAARRKALAEKLLADVAALQTSSADIDSVVNGYRKDYPRLRCEVGNFRCYFDQKRKELKERLSHEEREIIEGKIRAVDQGIGVLDAKVQSLEKLDELLLKGGANDSVQYAQILVQNKSTGPGGTVDKLKAYEALKGFHAKVLADLERLTGWKKDIDDAIAKPDLKAAWFFLYDFGKLLRDLEERLEKYPPPKLAEALNRAWCELAQAREALREAEGMLNDRTVDLQKKKAALQEARSTRRARILEILGKL